MTAGGLCRPTTTYPHVRVEGGPRERGRQYGEQARERIARSRQVYEEVFAHFAGWDWQRVREEALAFERPIADFDPRYLEEMRGIADGANLTAADVLAMNVRTEIKFAAQARLAVQTGGFPTECSAFVALPQATQHGHTILAQNWDWLPHASETVVVLEARQAEGPAYVTVVEAGLLAKTGFNSSGVGLTTNALVTDRDLGRPGVPYHVVLRAILDAETISDALGAIQRRPRSSSANYLIASRDGLAVNVEATPGDFASLFLLFPQEGLLAHTNHFLSPRFRDKDICLWLAPHSPFRLEQVRAGLMRQSGTVTVSDAMALLSSHGNFPLSVCCHSDPRVDALMNSPTVASVIMDLDAATMWLADGNPCAMPYRELDYRALLSKPSRLRPEAALVV